MLTSLQPGMFLYAKLVMHIVKTQDNLEDIRKETENLPTGLDQAYVFEILFGLPGNDEAHGDPDTAEYCRESRREE